MATMVQVRERLAATLDGYLSDVNVYTFVPDSVQPRAVVLVPAAGETNTMGRGNHTYVFNAVCVAAPSTSADGQHELDKMLDTTGLTVLAAIDDDNTLGLPDTKAHAAGWGEYGQSSFGDRDYYTAAIAVTVHTKGTV